MTSSPPPPRETASDSETQSDAALLAHLTPEQRLALEGARKQLREAIENDPGLARRMSHADEVAEPDDLFLERVYEGEFGRQVFVEQYGEELASQLEEQIRLARGDG
jgi:hypothetical protein